MQLGIKEGTHKWLLGQQDPILPDERTELHPEELYHYQNDDGEENNAQATRLRGCSVAEKKKKKSNGLGTPF
jgi:hypothetical protein